MNTRIDIKIAIVGEPNSGKETFAKMLFLDNEPKIRVNPLSTLAEVFWEIDPINFQNSSKKIVEMCKTHNTILMRQSEIKSIQDLRNKNVDPFFYRYTERIRDLINYSNKPHLNKYTANILFVWQ